MKIIGVVLCLAGVVLYVIGSGIKGYNAVFLYLGATGAFVIGVGLFGIAALVDKKKAKDTEFHL